MGRQKLKMEKIEDKHKLQVCFSKRRKGLFKKAKDLCTLSGAQIAMVVFSPAGKPFTFGESSVETLIDHFGGVVGNDRTEGSKKDTSFLLEQSVCDNGETLLDHFGGAVGNDTTDESKKDTSFILENQLQQSERKFRWNKYMESIDDIEQLQIIISALVKLKENVLRQLSMGSVMDGASTRSQSGSVMDGASTSSQRSVMEERIESTIHYPEEECDPDFMFDVDELLSLLS
ncbi:hypothetical protein HHK36_011516 [Tetracentron sinense]|uniref:MADS-box domain-containing protein n=1 Tax=Tetracentron sinense TaxID=13715 RepID=A0A834Y5L5_TETSI|nr:hypothetical protein HHK36_032183 [Tetracentron sinense]KAF8403413.1 hypothetical protein HHK36_011516 [Tetracentron sinense]